MLLLFVERSIEWEPICGQDGVDAGVVKVFVGICEISFRHIAGKHHVDIRTNDAIALGKEGGRTEFEIDLLGKMGLSAAGGQFGLVHRRIVKHDFAMVETPHHGGNAAACPV